MRRRTLLLTGLAALTARSARAAEPPVVLELFTSQGCSSCPPADALLGELSRQPGVIALAWHVDYWDSLGWHDPYATRLATNRQRAYAAQLRDEVYTPALVVNGARIVVGSDRRAVGQAMQANRADAVSVSLRRTGDALQAEIGGTAAPLNALLAVYDPERSTPVHAGENDGRRLREYRIVRGVQPVALPAGAARTIGFPAVPAGQGAALLLQSEDLRVVAAADLPPV